MENEEKNLIDLPIQGCSHFLIILLHGSLQGFLSYCNTLHISLHFLLHFLCIQAILHSSLQGLHGTEHFNLHFE